MKAILTWHSIDSSRSPISVSAESFARQIDQIEERRIPVVSLARIREVPSPALALSFDDGFANFLTDAWPVLSARQLPVTVFVVAKSAGRDNAWGGRRPDGIPVLPLLRFEELKTLASAGVEIGSHSLDHSNLKGLDDAALADDLVRSKEVLAERTGVEPESFAYPFGSFDRRIREAAGRVYTRAVTTRHDHLHGGDDPLALPRLDAYYFRVGNGLSAFGTWSFRRKVATRRLLRSARRLFAPDAPYEKSDPRR